MSIMDGVGQITLFDLLGEAPAAEEKPKEKPKKAEPKAEVKQTAKTTAREWALAQRSKPVQKNPVQEKFLKEWDQVTIEDRGSTTSDMFKHFARAFKKYICSINDDLELNWFTVGHYDMSASVNLFGVCSPMHGVLVRTQKEPKDYTGGNNNFTSVRALPLFLTTFARDEHDRRYAFEHGGVESTAA